MGIKISTPDINLSQTNFTENNGEILFGLGSIKGVGETSIPAIIENRPYQSLQDAIEKIDKKIFNKRVGIALIKSGAFDSFEKNRFTLLNTFYTIRKDKDDRFNESDYDNKACDKMEKEVLSTNVTNIPYWENVNAGEDVQVQYEVTDIYEKIDKKGKLMGFLTGNSHGCDIKAIVFAHVYCKNLNKIEVGKTIILKGTKDDKGTLIVSSIK